MNSAKMQIIKKEEFRWSFRKKGKNVMNICTHLLFLGSVGFALMAGTSSLAFANPMDGVVTGGTASIISTPTELQINQSSNSAMIDWKSFDIAAGETTHFYQPSANAVALNRVVNSTQASSINGNLLANGKIFVINQNGVLLGKTANVNTTGFIASTADITNNAFMNSTGTYDFNIAGNADASVINKGHISVQDAGLVAFVAPHVSNEGLIEGNLAKVQLGAGDMYGVDLYGDGLISLAVSAPQGSAKRKISADNSGSIITDGGKVYMTAAAASNVVDSVINNTGVIQAQGLTTKNGEVILTGAGAHVTVSGKIDVSGKNGGGKVKIGGDYQGKGTLAHAAVTNVTSGAVINANSTDTGNGGTIVVWGDEATYFQGSALAQGGANSGNGGLVETSSEGYLNIHGGNVNTSAANGEFGTWLLDPQDVVIKSGSHDGDDTGSGSGSQNVLTAGGTIYTTTPTTFDIYESEIEGQSATTNITIQATHGVTTSGSGTVTLASNSNLTIQTRNDAGDGLNTGAGINLSNLAFAATGTGSITLTASTGTGTGNITTGTLTTDTGAINISTDNGKIDLNKAITSTSGNITANASDKITTAGGNLAPITTGGTGIISLTSTGSSVATNSDILAGGAINVSAGTNAVLDGSTTTSGAGTITITASSGASDGYVRVKKLTAQNGNINVTTDQGSITVNDILKTTGTGNITLDSSTAGGITTGGDFVVNSGGTLTLNDTLTTGDGNIDMDAVGLLTTENITTTGGSIDLKTTTGSIITKNLTIHEIDTDGDGGVSTLNIDSADALTVLGSILVDNFDHDATPNYSESNATLKAVNNIGVSGGITVTSKDDDQSSLGSTANLTVISTSGNISVTGAVNVSSDASKTSSGTQDVLANSTATMTADNGSITLLNGINVIAQSVYSGFIVHFLGDHLVQETAVDTTANATINLHQKMP
jgi:filamentous hemagglutinin family protein